MMERGRKGENRLRLLKMKVGHRRETAINVLTSPPPRKPE